MVAAQIEQETMEQMVTNTKNTVFSLSSEQPIMLVFLRHFGCTFCREALADISKNRTAIEESGVRVVFVHMAEDDIADRYFKRYNLEGAVHISDPSCRFYAAFGLVKGNFTQLFGLNPSLILFFRQSLVTITVRNRLSIILHLSSQKNTYLHLL